MASLRIVDPYLSWGHCSLSLSLSFPHSHAPLAHPCVPIRSLCRSNCEEVCESFVSFLPKGARSESAGRPISTSSRETSSRHTHEYRPFIVVVHQLNYQMIMHALNLCSSICVFYQCVTVHVGILLLKCVWVFNFSTPMGGVKYWKQCE